MWRLDRARASKPSIAFGRPPDDKPPGYGGQRLVKSVSIEDAFQSAQSFVAREWRLLLPLALALLAMPQLAFNLLAPAELAQAMAKGDTQLVMAVFEKMPWVSPAAIVVELITLAGVLAITALALMPRISVREAISLGFRRLFVLVVILLLLSAVAVVLFVVLAGVLQLLRILPAAQSLPLILLVAALLLVVWIRLIALPAVIVASRAGPIASIRLAWELSAGAFWPLLGCILIYSIGAEVVVIASTFALGTIAVLLCKALGAATLGPILAILFATLANALFWAGFHVVAVALYRQLGGSIRGV
jgi:hypothetical protein